MTDRVLFTLTKKLANGNVATIPLTERQSNLISTLLDFHDGEFADEDADDAPYSVETLDEVMMMMLRNHLAEMP